MVVAGSDGWYFFNATGDFPTTWTRPLQPETTGTHSLDLQQNRSEWLRSLGIRYLYLPIPKEAVDEEHLALILEEQGIRQLLATSTNLRAGGRFTDFIDTKELLVRKNEAQLYFRTDSHWNSCDGSAYRAIVSRLQQWFPTSGRCGRRTGRNGAGFFRRPGCGSG